MSRTFDPQELVALLGDKHELTKEQKAIIGAPLGTALILAGAGSGKTETMANRVVFLIANGLVKPHEVLGMTFTRKAAGELRNRINKKLKKLNDELGGELNLDVFDQVTVSTYNSFASQIFSQYGVLIGRNPDAKVLGEAAAWQIARYVAKNVSTELVENLDCNLDQLTAAILDMARALSDNIVNPAEVVEFGEKLIAHLEVMPLDAPDHKGRKLSVDQENWKKTLKIAKTYQPLVAMSETYAELKRERNAVEFSDQVALAYEICQKFEHVVHDIRSQYKVVLLDEYQDTSVVQTKLLASLFRDHPVTAVGDPHQSIYGWRGASADNMEQFANQFVSIGAASETFSLLTSWRNPSLVLDGANKIVAPLAEKSEIEVVTLKSREGAESGRVDVVFDETIYDEAKSVAHWFKTHLTDNHDAAMLFRSTRTIPAFTRALAEADVKFHVVGIGGLLEQPGVVDVVCGMRVLHDATSDSELVRLLTGGRWRLALKDIRQLKKLATWISKHDYRTKSYLDDEIIDGMKKSVANEDTTSLVDALDFIARTTTEHSQLQKFSPEGLIRLQEAGNVFAQLRRSVGSDIREIITIMSQALLLDIEAIANDDNAVKASNIAAFQDLVTPYLDVELRPTLGGFLSWLTEAERRERLTPQSVEAEKGVVQIMTIHGAKGLEWDFVAVPRLVKDELPSNPSNADHWVALGRLPYEFRGDGIHLPILNWRAAQSQRQFEEQFDEFKNAVQERQMDEDRRLAYVAVTRTRQALLLSGSFWATQKTPREPSSFMQDVLQGMGRKQLVVDSVHAKNPVEDYVETVPWPADPLGSRRDKVERAAALVLTADSSLSTAWDEDIAMLLKEQERRLSGDRDLLPMPIRIPASKFKDFIDNPEKVAKQLRRPVPERPYRATNLGTIFHSWVEQRSQAANLVELLDAHPSELDGDASDVVLNGDELKLAELKKTFEASKWGNRLPLEVEREINLPFGSNYIVCKIDAIYDVPGQPGRVEIVDWKTGKAPKDKRDAELKQTQLALYRLAYSKAENIDPELIDVAFYFVADDTIVTPEKVYSEAELREAWSSVTGSKP